MSPPSVSLLGECEGGLLCAMYVSVSLRPLEGVGHPG